MSIVVAVIQNMVVGVYLGPLLPTKEKGDVPRVPSREPVQGEVAICHWRSSRMVFKIGVRSKMRNNTG